MGLEGFDGLVWMFERVSTTASFVLLRWEFGIDA